MTASAIRTISVSQHGRYLVELPLAEGPFPLLVGFHGYAESAEAQLCRLRRIPSANQWLRVAIQGLHRFYRGSTREVVASWLTREDRILAIQDNATFIAAVIDAIGREFEVNRTIVFAGFSQGAGMAFRAASATAGNISVIALGGDIPTELGTEQLVRIRAALVGRGLQDQWYTSAMHESDMRRLYDAGVRAESVVLDAAHEWAADFTSATDIFLSRARASAVIGHEAT